MKIKIITVGKRMPTWVKTAYEDYSKRLSHQFQIILHEINLPTRTKNADINKLMCKEADEILALIEPSDYVVALDEHGKSWSTSQLSTQLDKWQTEHSCIVFLIGGPDGLGTACKHRAQAQWSLSQLTLPHPLVRVVLIEQLYRAHSILQGHPYHRE
ncbi:MAG: 23S rRNA (pseudouridine(1915)-N(3))-methyltransferase RlmH [Gammaproteobacteria bacterium]|nr:23S rRNA (pseudouridine(1915)-N(3))-methyltransferase RlmH [Gammaproteobacteria bacterium]